MTHSGVLATQSYDFFLTTCHLANASQQTFCRHVISRKTDTTSDQELIQSMLSVLQFLSSLQAFLRRRHNVLKKQVPQSTVISLAAALSEHFVQSHKADKKPFTFDPTSTEFEPKQKEHTFAEHKQQNFDMDAVFFAA